MHRDLIKGIVFVALGATSYGILATFVKMAYQQGFTTAEVTSSQFLLGFAGLLFLNLIFRKKISVSDKNAGRNSVLKLILAGTSLGLTSLFYYYSVKYVPVSMGIVLLMQTTWMGIVLEMILARKLPSPGKISAVIGVLIGTALSTNLITNWQSIDLRGIGWGIMAALSYTIAVFSSNRIALELPFLRRSLWLILGGALMILSLSFQDLGQKFDSTVFWKWGILLSVFGTILPPLLFTLGLPLTGIGLGTIIASVEIPVSVLMAHILLAEPINTTQWLGIILIVGSIVLMNVRPERKIKARELSGL
ncbi:Threonine/homoserine efflux transporter RhtA [Pseudarcicella hirudinis]|uniref:Threonine/homoserine efflux transporter RhtA n=2 Tax=Pseudarcicella hirudinis TaxID=1079859 RepID=A0A1I5RKS5_9BACT|nr:Threonine/homoserine efflux transporter RhtA [Pseudarcicella hirudinis]